MRRSVRTVGVLALSVLIATTAGLPALAQDAPLTRYVPATIGGEPVVLDGWARSGDDLRGDLAGNVPDAVGPFDAALAAAGLRADEVVVQSGRIADDFARELRIFRFPGADAASFIDAIAPVLAYDRNLGDVFLRDGKGRGGPFRFLVGAYDHTTPLKQLDPWSLVGIVAKGDLLYAISVDGRDLSGEIAELVEIGRAHV